MKLNCKRIDFTYTPGEEIFAFPDESGLPFLFDVEKELTADPTAMDAVGKMRRNFFREPTRPSCPLSRWWTFCGLIALAAWWITR